MIKKFFQTISTPFKKTWTRILNAIDQTISMEWINRNDQPASIEWIDPIDQTKSLERIDPIDL